MLPTIDNRQIEKTCWIYVLARIGCSTAMGYNTCDFLAF
jgi:hypothetical protein